MRLSGILAAASALSLAATPIMAAPTAVPAPTAERVNGAGQLVDGAPAAFPWIPVAAFVIAALIAWQLLDDDDEPQSP